MIRASIYGRLGQDPKERQTGRGAPMATASLAVTTVQPGQEPATTWFSLLAFGKQAEILLRHRRGDLLATMGEMQRTFFTDRNGQDRESWSFLVETIVSARTTRPGGGRRRQRSDGHTAVEAAEPFNDDIGHVGREP